MNIWYLTSEYPPDFGGGISTYIDQASRMFAQAGHQVTVFVRDTEKDTIDYPIPGLRVVRFKHMKGEYYSWLGYWPALSYQIAEEVLNLIDQDGITPDLIEVQDYNALGYYLLQRKWLKDARVKNVPIVVHLHTPTFELSRINHSPRYRFPIYWIGQMEKFCIKAASALVTQSEFLKEQIQPYAAGKYIRVIPLPYELEKEGNSTNIEEFSHDFLYVGRLEYRKGVIQLLKEVDRLWEQGEVFTLTMLGGDTIFEPKNRLLGDILKEKYAKRVEQGLLTFRNSVPPEQLVSEIKKAKVVIIPSLYENYPYSCLISMALGCPVLVATSGGQAEMVKVHGENGFIFDWNIPEDFKRKIQSIMKMDNTTLKGIGMRGQERIQSLCNPKSNLLQRLDFFQTVINDEKESRIFPISDSVGASLEVSKPSGEEGLLSIIIPFYNLGSLLMETLTNVMESTYQPREIIIINDGSSDPESISILEQIRLKGYPGVKIINIPNGGLANARNVGAKEACGEYITFLDADDLVQPDFYSKALEILKSYDNISFVYSWVQYFGGSQSVWPTFNTEFPYFLGINMLAAFAVVRRTDFINHGLNRTEMEYGMEDYDSWLSMCASGLAGVSIPELLVNYRVRTDSMSRQFNSNMILHLFDRLSHGHPEIYEKYGLEIFNLLVANGPGYLWNNPSVNHPDVGYVNSAPNAVELSQNIPIKYELMRIANSKLGSWMVRTAFKLKLNKLF